MREVFQQELREVQDRLVEISDLVADSIENATQAFNESNVALAETVIADDDKIDALAAELDELAIQILARQQPVARDLRIVVSALRISASLERMGDMAEHIAQLARYRFPEKVVPKTLRPTFIEMGRLDVEIARKLTELLRTEDLDIAEHIRNEDDKIDALHLSVFDKVLGETWKGAAVDTVDATLASPLPRAVRRPRGLDRQEGAVPRDRRLDPGRRLSRRPGSEPAVHARHRHDAVELLPGGAPLAVEQQLLLEARATLVLLAEVDVRDVRADAASPGPAGQRDRAADQPALAHDRDLTCHRHAQTSTLIS